MEEKKQTTKPAQKADKKAEKSAGRATKKEIARYQKEWEDSIVATKRVKREEMRRKLKQAMIIMLVFALIVTSIVYVMLLFIQENNVRITAGTKAESASLSLSMDNNLWSPYINAGGPTNIWNVSYNANYSNKLRLEKIDTRNDVIAMLNSSSIKLGENNGENFSRFVFMVKNSGKAIANVSYEMTLEYDKRGLHKAVRVMWGESYKNIDSEQENDVTNVDVYAALSDDPRLANTNINIGATAETGYREYVSYPVGSELPDFDLLAYERTLTTASALAQAEEAGYFAAEPFYSNDYVFRRDAQIESGGIMYCYVCIWIEGSDFDCIDAVRGGSVKLGINFMAY